MKKLWARIQSLLSSRKTPLGPTLSQEELETAFKTRYHHFKLLLAANTRALELMADMEEALVSGDVFGMSFVRGRTTAMGVAVYQMIRYLCDLAPGKYEILFSRLESIQQEMDGILAEGRERGSTGLVVGLDEVDKDWADQVGAKMANLGEMKNRLGLPVPSGFVLSAEAYDRFFESNDLQAEINRLIQAAVLERTDQLFVLSSDIKQRIVRAELPEDLAGELDEAYRKLAEEAGPGARVCLRSSAIGEDTEKASFAGQYASQLNVSRENLHQAYKEVVAGKYSPQAMSYRQVRGIRDEDVPMCVGCLVMVEPRAGGVVYSRNALDIRDRNIHVSSALGLPKTVVDGDSSVDRFVVSRGDAPAVLERHIARKSLRYDCYGEEGVYRSEVPAEEADLPSLDDSTVLALADAAVRLEAHYGVPQDIEWAQTGDGELVFLQCRPLRQVQAGDASSRPSATGAEVLLTGGVRVSPGAASGPVYWVRKDGDALGFPEGAVLAVSQALPRWAALLGKAVAVISEMGGPAGHLATVAREYGLPGLFDLKDEAGRLRNGDWITLDADGLTVYRGRVGSVLRQAGPRKSLMDDSPVYNLLKRVVQHVAPLSLTDPDSHDFQAKNCRSLHDITRFCHEKSVQEMFDFGKDRHSRMPAAKQLFYEVPMKYWVIDLEDGFHQKIEGKYVRLDNITSRPMLAVWEGMTAVPWDGPPAIHGRGLASVLFQATTDPSLTTPYRTRYATKNYFMISRNFLNLQSRFGFHFCTVEARVDERKSDNYIRFTFKGGAADLERRKARVRFIDRILDEFGFQSDIKDDLAVIRLDGRGPDFTLDRLKIIGYILMHTRQLDMIMTHPPSVSYYRRKLRDDIVGFTVFEPAPTPTDNGGGSGATAGPVDTTSGPKK